MVVELPKETVESSLAPVVGDGEDTVDDLRIKAKVGDEDKIADDLEEQAVTALAPVGGHGDNMKTIAEADNLRIAVKEQPYSYNHHKKVPRVLFLSPSCIFSWFAIVFRLGLKFLCLVG